MTQLLLKIFGGTDPSSPSLRGKLGSMAGAVGIVCNLILCAAKLTIGLLSGAVSIVADAVNNLTDAGSSLLTIIGFRLSAKPADDEHPYGYARIEYLSGLAVAAIILIIGFELGKSSIDKLLHPEQTEITAVTIVVLLLSVAVKLWLSVFYKKVGKVTASTTLEAASADSRNDVISTAAVLLSAVITLLFRVDLDGWFGIAVAAFILYSGIGIAKETIKPLLGETADDELVKMVSEEILGFDDCILGIHDLMVHDYGPQQKYASVHAEIDYRRDVMSTHEVLDDIERMFLEKHRIHLVIHYDPIVTDDAEVNRMKAIVTEQLASIDDRILFHDFRMVTGEEHTNLIFDVVLPHELEGKAKEVEKTLTGLINAAAGDGKKYYLVLTFDDNAFNPNIN